MSPHALALYTYLKRQPEGAEILIEELTIFLHASRTKVRLAFTELEEAQLLTYTQEA